MSHFKQGVAEPSLFVRLGCIFLILTFHTTIKLLRLITNKKIAPKVKWISMCTAFDVYCSCTIYILYRIYIEMMFTHHICSWSLLVRGPIAM